MSFIKDQKNKFIHHYGKGDTDIFFSPGRVNLIGEHLDYNGGYVLPAAISLGIYGFIRPRNDRIIKLKSSGFEDEINLDLDNKINFKKPSHWSNYPAGVIKYLKELGHELNGCEILYASTLPDGSGLSSSAAIEVLTGFMMIHDRITSELDRVKLAELCRKVENEFIGVQCGIMDQFAVAMGKEKNAMLLNSSSMDYKYVPIDPGSHALIIMNSNKPRKLNESKFNERQKECRDSLEQINKFKKLGSLAEASLDDLLHLNDPVLKKRARHVITENKRVLESIELLKRNDIKSFGRLLVNSHDSLKDDYEVTGRELDCLVYSALEHESCSGARMTGAGFGGCAIALVNKNYDMKDFKSHVSRKYKKETGLDPHFYETSIGDGVEKL